jgi:hypothetical protein
LRLEDIVIDLHERFAFANKITLIGEYAFHFAVYLRR